tara:strand:+ start:1411 stop:3618 length:2208 start_codon:yes stop_codon:yes gene_type:complete
MKTYNDEMNNEDIDHEHEVIEINIEDLSPEEADALLLDLKEQEEKLKAEMEERINRLGYSLQRKADEQVALKQVIETRWLDDVRQYNGRYDQATESQIRKRKGSMVFANITRHKADSAEARLADMLFPTDDKNWGIQPTPVPELQDMKRKGGMGVDPNGAEVDLAVEAIRLMEEAARRAKAMENEIDDQLNQCDYNSEGRDVIHDAVLLGTGILKGPVVEGRYRKSWMNAKEGQALEVVQEIAPCARRVSPWDWFPDMSATRLAEVEFQFERHHFTRSEMSNIAQLPGFNEDAIRQVLTSDKGRATAANDNYIAQLREISGYAGELGNDNRYEVWEYHGPIDRDDLEAAGLDCCEDELDTITGTVWFCGNKVLKVSLNPLATQEMPYSIFCFSDDDSSIFGVGVPYLLRNTQSVYNSAWRMIMDNSGLSSGPQIVVNRQIIEPADGDWTITPKKVWFLKDKTRQVHEAFGSFEISSHQAELANILQISRMLADEETSVPAIAQGIERGASQTAQGMSMLMNNANIVMKRAVKVWDDNVTRKMLRRFYDYNMQFSDKQEIKGDFQIDARGSSAMMAREMQMQAMGGLMNLAQSPAFGPLTKFPELYRMALRQMQIPVGEIVKSDDEIAAEQQQMSQQPPVVEDPIGTERLKLDAQKLQADIQFKQSDAQTKAQQVEVERMRAQLNYEADMAKIANSKDMTLAQLKLQLGIKEMDVASKEKLMAFETQVKQAYGTGL